MLIFFLAYYSLLLICGFCPTFFVGITYFIIIFFFFLKKKIRANSHVSKILVVDDIKVCYAGCKFGELFNFYLVYFDVEKTMRTTENKFRVFYAISTLPKCESLNYIKYFYLVLLKMCFIGS